MCEADEATVQELIRQTVARIEKIQAQQKVTLADRRRILRLSFHKGGLDTALAAIIVNRREDAERGKKVS